MQFAAADDGDGVEGVVLKKEDDHRNAVAMKSRRAMEKQKNGIETATTTAIALVVVVVVAVGDGEVQRHLYL